jgi:RHS repeat-associated protein
VSSATSATAPQAASVSATVAALITASGSGSGSSISAVGSLASNNGTGLSTLAVTPATVGDLEVLAVGLGSTTPTVSSVSGGGVTSWSKLEQYDDSAFPTDVELWMGKVTTAGSSTVTVSFSSSVASDFVELSDKEFTAGLGSGTTWSKDTASGLSNASSTTATFPTLTPAGSSELYIGYGVTQDEMTAGSTSGFTYNETPNGDEVIYDPSVSSATSATAPQAASVSATVAALITASGSGGGGCPTGSVSGSAPIVISVSPCTGSTGGGTAVIITGANFTGVTGVKFGTVSATSYTVVNSTTIDAVAPAGTGTADVTVTTANMRLEELAAYSAYGVQTIQSGADVTPFGFQGSYTDPSGLIYLVNRYYDPATDQFISVDPDVAETGQPYAYDNDDPLNETDPIGLAGSLPSKGEFPYKPPKGGPKRVRGGGWKDANGNTWRWDKSGHGGGHWDVTPAHGPGHTNVFPDGSIRKQGSPRSQNSSFTVTPSAELGPNQQPNWATSGSASQGGSTSFQVPALKPPPWPALGVIGVIVVVGGYALAAG